MSADRTPAPVAAVWVAKDENHILGVAADAEVARNLCEREIEGRTFCTFDDDDGWYEPQLPEYRDGTQFTRWYDNSAIVKGATARCVSVRRYDLTPRPEPVVDGPGFGDYWTPDETPEPVVAPLPTEAVEALARIIATAIGCGGENAPGADECDPDPSDYHAANAILAAGYRLVPEDAEDAVRVPREAVERLAAGMRQWQQDATYGHLGSDVASFLASTGLTR